MSELVLACPECKMLRFAGIENCPMCLALAQKHAPNVAYQTTSLKKGVKVHLAKFRNVYQGPGYLAPSCATEVKMQVVLFPQDYFEKSCKFCFHVPYSFQVKTSIIKVTKAELKVIPSLPKVEDVISGLGL